MYEYQKSSRFFAQTADDIKDFAATELAELGACDISPVFRGIYFNADKAALYRINYSARLISRVLAPILTFKCHSTDQLYKKAKQINWSDFLSTGNTFALFSNVSDSKINNSYYASLCIKDAIVDSFREMTGKRPDVNAKDPDLWINLFITRNKAVISLDTSGGPLHKRGYRKDSLAAPMQETVAAVIIRYTEWDGSVPLYDPMCGSGTLLIEAMLYYCKIPSGFLRKTFGFEFLPDFDKKLWRELRKDCDRRKTRLPKGLISGSDISSQAVKSARSNVNNIPEGKNISINNLDFNRANGLENGVIVTNPPYGIRMGDKEELGSLYKSMGDFLKQKCKGSTAYIYFGEREFIKKIGLNPAWKKPLMSGGLDGRLVKYEMF
ncbi:MAG: class I SAM-dependent RNA methyltransferase [Nitrospiraceae bacterium]|nr:MAG: class I SAM-dependent RNA methyltransferase [Nitrospiraceae bacterium]